MNKIGGTHTTRWRVTGLPATEESPVTLAIDADSADHAKEQYRTHFRDEVVSNLTAREVRPERTSQ